MHFFKLLSVAAVFVPTLITATPAPTPVDDSSLEAALTHELFARQSTSITSITDLIGSLGDSIKAIESLLSSTSLQNIESVVTDLADLLAAPTGNQTKALIGTASSLLESDAVGSLLNQLPSLLSSVSGLITPTLVTNLTDILGSAHELLTPTFVSQTTGLINDVAPLISAISQVISALLSAVLG